MRRQRLGEAIRALAPGAAAVLVLAVLVVAGAGGPGPGRRSPPSRWTRPGSACARSPPGSRARSLCYEAALLEESRTARPHRPASASS